MSRRRRATLAPTLFPFLAVLICTLGTLILLLALVAQKADETAEQAAREKAAGQLDARQAIAKQQWLRSELVSLRDQQTETLERRRSELAHLEERQRKLLEELKHLKTEIEAAEEPVTNPAEQQMVISALKKQIDAERSHVEKLKAEISGRRPRVIITAHEGPYGTERRPVYVECTEDAIVLQPEGARIELAQLAGALGPSNPLDAALRTVRLYWQKTEPDSPAPYPLLVVRPGGIASYAAARRAMASWDDQFGYELVPEDVELAFPKADESLRRDIELAIQDAASRQRARIASAQNASGNGFGRGGQPRVLSAANLSRRGSGTGGRHFNRSIDPEQSAGGSTIHPDDIRDFDTAMKAAAADSSGFGSGDASLSAVAGTASTSLQGGDGSLAASRAAAATGGQSTAGGPAIGLNDLQAGQAGGEPGRRGESDHQSSSDHRGSSGADDGSRGARSAGDAGSSEHGGSSGALAQSSAGATSGTIGPGGPDSAGSATPPPADGPRDQSADQAPPNAGPAAQQAAKNKSRLRRSGRHWALPDNVRGTSGSAIERRINVTCKTDAFVLAPERAGLAAREIPIGDGSAEDAAMELATVVHDRVESWGVALASGRWQPVLRISVQPGAERRFHELQSLLRGSGLNIEQR